MSIWLVLGKFKNGGIEKFARVLAAGLQENNIKIDLLAGIIETEKNVATEKSQEIIPLSSNGGLASLFSLIQKALREQPKIIISTANDISCIALILKAVCLKKTKVIINQHLGISATITSTSGLKRAKLIILKFFLRRLIKHADAIIAVSKGIAEDLAKSLCINHTRIQVIYNPVIDNAFQKKADEKLKPDQSSAINTAPGIRKIIYAGRLNPEKRLDILLDAYATIKNRTETHLLIAGDGPLLPWLKDQIKNKKLEESCTLFGFLDNPLPLIKASDLLVLTSDYEGLPTILIEALGCGTPIVSTDCPYGPAEILNNGEYGFLVPTNNPTAFAEAINKALSGDVIFATKKLQGRANLFNVESAISQYIQLLKSL